ncbi:MAG: MoaD/ThiS family protein [Rhodospirillales bacterium]|nr:MoaD/ThiS family protein [Rhodospirillales bacterium]
MKIRVKLFAMLSSYLPDGAQGNEVDYEVDDGATPGAVIDRLHMPRASCHLVLINGFYTQPSQLDSTPLHEGDALAIWPPIAGG